MSTEHTLKVIITDESKLRNKYRDTGLRKICDELSRLILSDKKRGVETRIFRIDSSEDMSEVGGRAVGSSQVKRATKEAIDDIYADLEPDYMMILGGPDVVEHQSLRNPLAGGSDPDNDVPSDLPYACEHGYHRDVNRFIGPTRVVGRLPDLVGDTNPDYLIRLIVNAQKWRAMDSAGYKKYFGLSCDVWKRSTRMSLRKVFGTSADIHLSPPDGPNWSKQILGARAHFINCHGSLVDPQFYGQLASSYPVSHRSGRLMGKVTAGTVVAAECCYGAELYDANEWEVEMGIANRYLYEGAYGYLGSTNVAYGPANGNGAADYMCQFFMREVLNGASLGRALLQARHEYVNVSAPLDPIDLKTLAQFYLLGDPSVHPTVLPELGKETQKFLSERSYRRHILRKRGRRLQMMTASVEAPTELKGDEAMAAKSSASKSLAFDVKEGAPVLKYRIEPAQKMPPRHWKHKFAKASSRGAMLVVFDEGNGAAGGASEMPEISRKKPLKMRRIDRYIRKGRVVVSWKRAGCKEEVKTYLPK